MDCRFVFAEAPRRIYWEVTRACDLACRHCRAEAMPRRSPDELTTTEALRLLDELSRFGTPAPHVILTGGDPLKRPDLLALVEHAVGVRLPVLVAPSATGLLTRERVRALRAAGIEAMSLSLDGSSRVGGPVITTTEAPHYRRVALQRLKYERRSGEEVRRQPLWRGFGIRDGNGIMFVSHTGEICPSGFLPLPAGNVRKQSPVEVYWDAPLFRALRQPDGFGGKCGRCEFRTICGGSRARAYAATGDPLGPDPLCAYEP